MLNTIPPRSAVAFKLSAQETLRVRDPQGQQVSDLFCVNAHDPFEKFSAARTMDEVSRLWVSVGDGLMSNRGNRLLTVMSDSCGRHDLLMPPCREVENGHPGCQENLALVMCEYLSSDEIGVAFNIFMNVVVTPTGVLQIHPPHSKPSDEISFVAEMDLIVGLTACAHLVTNGGVCKPMEWEIAMCR